MIQYPEDFVLGAAAMGYLIVGLFFFRFWRQTSDGLFLTFAAAFWVLAASEAAFRRPETFSVSSHKVCSSGRSSLMSRLKVVSAEMLLVSRSGSTLRASMPRASRHSRCPSSP